MPSEVIMPKVDMDMSEGKIAVWHIESCGWVEKGDALFDIETDKAAMEVEAPATGTLQHVRLQVGQTARIGEVVAWIYAADEEIGEPPLATAAPLDVSLEPVKLTMPDPKSDLPVEIDKPRATPAARKLAAELDISLETLTGSAVRGRILRADVAEAGNLASASAIGQLAVAHRGPREGQAGRSPFVLLHGLAADAGGWRKLMAELGPDVPVATIELPCHGGSHMRPPANFRALVSEVRRGLDELDLDGVHLVGHSLGGAVALALADTRPRSVARLSLLAPAGLGPEIDGDILLGLLRATRAESLSPWLRRMVADPEFVTDAYVRLAMSARSDEQLRQAQIRLADAIFPDATQTMDLRAALNRLEMPTRIVWGREDAVIPWRHALVAPGRVSLNLFEATGHLPHLERAKAVADLLLGKWS